MFDVVSCFPVPVDLSFVLQRDWAAEFAMNSCSVFGEVTPAGWDGGVTLKLRGRKARFCTVTAQNTKL